MLMVSCYTTRKINHDYSRSKLITRQAFTSGEASCANGNCLQIDKEKSTENCYTFYGSKPIAISGKMKVKKKENGKSFVVKVKLTNLLGQRDKANEIKMLDLIERTIVSP